MDYDALKIIGAALGLGLLVGLQREYVERATGIRTFALVTLLGTIVGLTTQHLASSWYVGMTALSFTILISMLIFRNIRDDDANLEIGATTTVALLVMFALGVYLAIGNLAIGVVLGALVAMLLHMKGSLSNFVDRLHAKDVKAIMLLAALALIILPLLPDENYGPYDVLNPYDIWRMVVLIVGLSITGYFFYKTLGKDIGAITNGILGGLISSTATTVTFAKHAASIKNLDRTVALIIMIASTVSIGRVMFEITVVSPQNSKHMLPPIGLLAFGMILISAGLYYFTPATKEGEFPDPENPANLKTAVVFASLYGLILIGVAAAQDYFGESGLYIVTIISGFTDVDAITLSLANTLNRGGIDVEQAWNLVTLGILSNLFFKGILAAVLGSKRLGYLIAITFVPAIIIGLAIIWLWPS